MSLKSLTLASLLLLSLAPASSASSHGGGTRTIAPPGNSGISQYVEVIPTQGGGRPSSTLHAGGGGASGPGGGSTGGGGAVTPKTARALTRGGPDGAAVAALAKATGPSKATNAAGGAQKGRALPALPPTSGSPFSVLSRAVTGSTGGGGLGPWLPAILVATVFGLAGAALVRRRRVA